MTPLFFKKVGLSFARTFLIVFVLGLIPVWDNVINWDPNASKAALLAVIAAAGTAGIRAAQALFTTLETPPA